MSAYIHCPSCGHETLDIDNPDGPCACASEPEDGCACSRKKPMPDPAPEEPRTEKDE